MGRNCRNATGNVDFDVVVDDEDIVVLLNLKRDMGWDIPVPGRGVSVVVDDGDGMGRDLEVPGTGINMEFEADVLRYDRSEEGNIVGEIESES